MYHGEFKDLLHIMHTFIDICEDEAIFSKWECDVLKDSTYGRSTIRGTRDLLDKLDKERLRRKSDA